MESQELLTVIRQLREARRAKRKEETKEEARLEKLRLRLIARLNSRPQPPDGEPVGKAA